MIPDKIKQTRQQPLEQRNVTSSSGETSSGRKVSSKLSAGLHKIMKKMTFKTPDIFRSLGDKIKNTFNKEPKKMNYQELNKIIRDLDKSLMEIEKFKKDNPDVDEFDLLKNVMKEMSNHERQALKTNMKALKTKMGKKALEWHANLGETDLISQYEALIYAIEGDRTSSCPDKEKAALKAIKKFQSKNNEQIKLIADYVTSERNSNAPGITALEKLAKSEKTKPKLKAILDGLAVHFAKDNSEEFYAMFNIKADE